MFFCGGNPFNPPGGNPPWNPPNGGPGGDGGYGGGGGGDVPEPMTLGLLGAGLIGLGLVRRRRAK
ncbi:MAG: PEP-CTERM sorting domain-containing protein [Alphaproteobacteria bacterium]|nr:PEP-CTERM sorting domain-containing protein [Alphaproteobacteria bacterium]